MQKATYSQKQTSDHSFKPVEIIFCPTSACNLHCSHCFVSRTGEKLSSSSAIKFLKSCISESHGQIQSVGFSGGEPFLDVDFICKLSKVAVENDLLFDRITTNGAWWKDENELEQSLTQVRNSGFDGKIGVSWDTFHGTSVQKVTAFIKTAQRIFGNNSCVEILSVVLANSNFHDNVQFTKDLKYIASELNGKITPKKLVYSKTGNFAIYNKKTSLFVPVHRFAQSFLPPENANPNEKIWNDKKWFTDDFCAHTGQVFYVHSNGKVAPCCGFSNESEELIIGTVNDSYTILMQNAARNKMVDLCYNQGLGKIATQMEKNGAKTGRTLDMCQFCAYVCKNK